MESCCLENQTQALERSVPLHEEQSNALYMQELIKVPNTKLAAHTMKPLSLQI